MLYTIQDWINIFRFLKGETVEELEPLLAETSSAQRAAIRNYFSNVVDQIAFTTDDWKRFRKFLIDWYATFGTIVTTSKNVNDVFSLPETHIEELIRSLGFPVPTVTISFLNKVLMALDLVNLYKIKGTPKAIISGVTYAGLTNSDIVEYHLLKNSLYVPVFRPFVIEVDRTQLSARLLNSAGAQTAIIEYDTSLPDLDYRQVTERDPHWQTTFGSFLAVSDGESLPMKSPYFSLRVKIPVQEFKAILSILARRVRDEYEVWFETGELVQIIDVDLDRSVRSLRSFTVSLLELYLACVYSFNRHLNRTTGSEAERFFVYDGTNTDVEVIVEEYQNFVFTKPDTRASQKEKLEEFYSVFTRPTATDFIAPDSTGAGVFLEIMSPDFKAAIDEYFEFNQGEEVLTRLLFDLAAYIEQRISINYPSLAIYMLSTEFIEDFIKQVIFFFKPYRARFLGLIFQYFIYNPLSDSVIPEDQFVFDNLTHNIFDWHTADSLPCFAPDGGYLIDVPDTVYWDATNNYHARDHYDCGDSNHDIGACVSPPESLLIDVTSGINDIVICVPPSRLVTGDFPWEFVTKTPPVEYTVDGYIFDTTTGLFIPHVYQFDSRQYVYTQYVTCDASLFCEAVILDSTEPSEVAHFTLQEGAWPDFDSHGFFDCLTGRDSIFVRLEQIIDSTELSFINIWGQNPWGQFPWGSDCIYIAPPYCDYNIPKENDDVT